MRLVALGDRLGRRWWAVTVLAVGVARLAAGRLWVGLRWTLAERGGLSLACARGLVQPQGVRTINALKIEVFQDSEGSRWLVLPLAGRSQTAVSKRKHSAHALRPAVGSVRRPGP